MKNLITIEHVGEGHPDKVADTISTWISDLYLLYGGKRTAIEVMIGHGVINISGEVSIANSMPDIINYQLKPVGDFADMLKQFHEGYEDYQTNIKIANQSQEIEKQVNRKDGETGAGDQGIMVGVACSNTESKLPIEKDLILKIDNVISTFTTLKPEIYKKDYKIQLTIALDGEAHKIERAHIAIQLEKGKKDYSKYSRNIKNSITAKIQELDGVLPVNWDDISIIFFHKGGANADVGMTGRKLVCDAYGPRFPIGGGATAGKDLSKVDRSGKIYARWLAIQFLDFLKHVNILINGDMHSFRTQVFEVETQIAYIIGEELPLHIDFKVNGVPVNESNECNFGKLFTGWLDRHTFTLSDVIEKIKDNTIQ